MNYFGLIKEKEESENLTQEININSNQISVEPIDPEDYLKEESSNFNLTPLNPEPIETSINQKDGTNTSLANETCLGEEKE